MLSKGIGRYYKVSEDGENLIRTKKFCPRCGPGTFMAEMYDRIVCGHCGFTEFKKKPIKKAIEEFKDMDEGASKPKPRKEKEKAKPKKKRK